MYTKTALYALALSVLCASLWSCDSSKVYDNMLDLDSNAWNEAQELSYPFTIEDTTVAYKLYYTIRYDNNYPFYNLYINRVLEDSLGKLIQKKLQGMDLFQSETGFPRGSGIGSKKDFMILSEGNFKFPYTGNYTIKLKQYMRQENVSGISAIGFRIEKQVFDN